MLQVVAVRNYQPHGKQENEGKEEEEEETGGGDVEAKEEEVKQDATNKNQVKLSPNKKEEEPCLEGLTDEIQDMLVVCIRQLLIVLP